MKRKKIDSAIEKLYKKLEKSINSDFTDDANKTKKTIFQRDETTGNIELNRVEITEPSQNDHIERNLNQLSKLMKLINKDGIGQIETDDVSGSNELKDLSMDSFLNKKLNTEVKEDDNDKKEM